MITQIDKTKTNFFIYILLLTLSILIPLNSIINPQLFNDEVLTFYVNLEVLNSLYNFNIKNFLIEILKDWHPPARNIFSTIFISVFGENITSQRIPYFFFWILSCIMCVKITEVFSGHNFTKFLVAILVAGSGLFHLQVIGFGHGIVTFLGLYIIFKLSIFFKYKKTTIPFKEFNFISLICFIGFLFINTFILITINLYLIQLFLIIRNKYLYFSKFLLSSFLFGSLYIIYLMIFIGLPYMVTNDPQFVDLLLKTFGNLDFGNWDQEPFGHYHQYLSRGSTVNIAYNSLLENISYLNWYFFPFIPILIIPISLIYLYSKNIYIFFLLINYFVVTNFLLSGNSSNHFASMFIWLIPFFCLSINNTLKNLLSKLISITFCIVLIFYTTICHLYPYNQSTYPFNLAEKLKGHVSWPHNLNRPLKLISNEIKSHKLRNYKIGYLNERGNSALINYYFKNNRVKQLNFNDLQILSDNNLCENYDKKLRILITNNTMPTPCEQIVEKVKIFENYTTVYLLK